MNYMLLGLLWAAQTQPDADWDGLDQLTALPAGLRKLPPYSDGVHFFKHGKCSAYKNTAHYFDIKHIGHRVAAHAVRSSSSSSSSVGNDVGDHSTWNDLHNRSCLNGFAFVRT